MSRSKKATHEIAKRQLYGSKKYNKDSIIGTRHTSDCKWLSSPPKNHDSKPNKTNIAYGNATSGSSMRGRNICSY